MPTAVHLPNVYTAIAEYHAINDITKQWRNSYDFFANTTPVPGDTILVDLAAFALDMIFADSMLDVIKVYNWSRGSNPYPTGLPLFENNQNLPGTADAGWVFSGGQPPAGNEVCLRVDKPHVGTGRPGRLFFRNFIPASNLQAARGERWSLVPSTPITSTQFTNILGHTQVGQYMQGTPFTDGRSFVTVQFSPKTFTVHGFQYDLAWELVGATVNKTGRKNKK